MKNRNLPIKEYKGYGIKPVINGIHVVYRNNQIIAVEPSLQIAMQAIDNRTYSNPEFNKMRNNRELEKLSKFKRKKTVVKEKINPVTSIGSVKEYEVVNVGSNVEVEVVKGNKKK